MAEPTARQRKTLTVHDALVLADRHRRGGRHERAEEIVSQVLAAHPDNADALHLQALTLHDRGEVDEAVRMLERAVAVQPDKDDHRLNLATMRAVAGRRAEARAAVDLALAADPPEVGAVKGLARTLIERKRPEEAVEALEAAAPRAPDDPELFSLLGDANGAAQRPEAAARGYRRAAELAPDRAGVWNNLGSALADAKDYAAAEEALREALRRDPALASAHYNLGHALTGQDRFEEAMASYRAALHHKPGMANAHLGMANVLVGLLRLDAALEEYDAELAARPRNATANLNRAIVQLMTGDLARGFRGFEWRFRDPAQRRNTRPRSYRQKRWRGGPVEGRTVFLWAEQGLGDTLQFVRYIPLLAARGARVLVEAQPAAAPLVETVEGVAGIVANGDRPDAFDLHCPQMSLPLAFGTTLGTIPADVPYLRVPDDRAGAFDDIPSAGAAARDALCLDEDAASPGAGQGASGPPRRLSVGLVWGGSPGHANDRRRSIPLSALAPLADLAAPPDDPDASGLVLYSLQKGPPRDQLAGSSLPVTDLADRLEDLADTAAALARLDLLITVDTAPAHLAGALARPVWTLLPFAPDWRWLVGRPDSPWYPTMRLWRQEAPGDWDGVAARVAAALRTALGAP